MFEYRDRSGNVFRNYEIYADDCDLFEGDSLIPGEEIGIDVNSGLPIYVDYWGLVATVFYNPMKDSFRVMVLRIQDHENQTDDIKGSDEAMPALA